VIGGVRSGFAVGAADTFQAISGSARRAQPAAFHCSKSDTILSEPVNRGLRAAARIAPSFLLSRLREPSDWLANCSFDERWISLVPTSSKRKNGN
jgi:hypothetical protein